MPSTVNSIISGLAIKLKEIKPGCKVYDRKLPQSFSKNSFYIHIADHTYDKELSNRYRSTVMVDIAYFSAASDIEGDCRAVAEDVMRDLDLFGEHYRAQEKISRITDDVLHIIFNINYSEVEINATAEAMQGLELTEGIKEE